MDLQSGTPTVSKERCKGSQAASKEGWPAGWVRWSSPWTLSLWGPRVELCPDLGPSTLQRHGAVVKVDQRHHGCPIPGGAQGQVGWDPGQPGLGLELYRPFTPKPFHDSIILHPLQGKMQRLKISVIGRILKSYTAFLWDPHIHWFWKFANRET